MSLNDVLSLWWTILSRHVLDSDNSGLLLIALAAFIRRASWISNNETVEFGELLDVYWTFIRHSIYIAAN